MKPLPDSVRKPEGKRHKKWLRAMRDKQKAYEKAREEHDQEHYGDVVLSKRSGSPHTRKGFKSG